MEQNPSKSSGDGMLASVKRYACELFGSQNNASLKPSTPKISTGRGGAGNFMRSSSRDVEPESKGHVPSDKVAARVRTSWSFA